MELRPHPELAPAWRAVRDELRHSLGDSTFDIWLAQVEPKAWDGVVLLLEAPSATRAWLADRFGRILDQSARTALGPGARIAFTGDPAHTAHAALAAATSAAVQERFVPRYTFEQFIIGDGNRLAHAAALAVAEAPGDAYNPLFLSAPPGLGKTHLLHAIGNYLSAFDPASTVRYTTVEAFTNGFIAALNARALDRFKRLYRDVDVLLIDDVQFLASKAKTEEEFFHTFNALYDSGRQLVLTCDRLPRRLQGVEERLRARFESGLVAELTPPDRATRIAILRKRACLDRISVADERVFALIADRITDNIRSLEGALIRVVAHHSLTGRPIDVKLADAVLAEIHPLSTPPGPAQTTLTTDSIRSRVAAYFELPVDALVSQGRSARVSWARQVAIHLARELTGASLAEVGSAFGGRNPATVLHACRRVAERVAASKEDAADVTALSTSLTARPADRPC